MQAWFTECETHQAKLVEWYEPLVDRAHASGFSTSLEAALRYLRRQWARTLGTSQAWTIECEVSPGTAECELVIPRARLWKGPLRVLLEQKKYGVLGRVLRIDRGLLTPTFSPPMMSGTGEGARVDDAGILEVTFAGETISLRQDLSGEVTLPEAKFLPGDLLEFPLFLLFAHAHVPSCRGAAFNPMGSPFLGTTVMDAAGASPGTLRLHDNMIAMRFQLHLNMTRGAFSSLSRVLLGSLVGHEQRADTPTPPVPSDATLQAMNDEALVSYLVSCARAARRQVIRRARPQATAPQIRDFVRQANRKQQALRQLEALNRRAEQARARAALEAMTPEARQRAEDEADFLEARMNRLRADYGALANNVDLSGTKVFARGYIYGGSLNSSAPEAYGQPYRYSMTDWGGMRNLATLRAYGSVPAAAESQRLTSGWTCTPSTLATTYFLLHGKKPGIPGSIRSHYDDQVSLLYSSGVSAPQGTRRASSATAADLCGDYCVVDPTTAPEPPAATTPAPSGGRVGVARMARFRTIAGFEADPNAMEELLGQSAETARRYLAQLSPVPSALNRAADDAREGLTPSHLPISLPDLRRYFLGLYNAAYTVVTLSGHEFMLFWIWPHARLSEEPVQRAGEMPPPFETRTRTTPEAESAERNAGLGRAYGVTGETSTASLDPDEYPEEMNEVGDAGASVSGLDATDPNAPITVMPDGTPETLYEDAVNARPDSSTAPDAGPPVAGFVAAYNPLDGTPFGSTDLGDLFGYEAGGGLKRLRHFDVADANAEIDGGLIGRSGFTGKPARFQPVQQVWVKHIEHGRMLFDDISKSSRTSQWLIALTHFDRDILRRIYRNPIAWEPIVLSNPRADDASVDAFTRAPLPRNAAPSPVPKDRASVVAAWYADRAVPYPTLLETRDDALFLVASDVERHTNTVVERLRVLLNNPRALTRSYESGRLNPRTTFDEYKGSVERFIDFLKS